MSLNLILSVPASINPEGVQVRTAGEQDSPLFCLMDVCRVLNLPQVHRVANRLAEDERTQSTVIDVMGRPQSAWFVTEPGLYRVVMRSDREEARLFSRWVCHEVLPCIRKHGCYPAPAHQQQSDNGPLLQVLGQIASQGQATLQLLTILAQEIRTQREQLPMAPQFVPTGGVIGIAEQVTRLWRTANKRQRERCSNRVRAVCMQRGIQAWQPVNNGPYVINDCNAFIINDVVNEIRELDVAPLFNLNRQTAMSN